MIKEENIGEENAVKESPREKKRSGSLPEKLSPYVEKFLKELEEQADVDAKLAFALKMMQETIAQEKGPDFKAFWQARTKALEFFKENVAPLTRATLWNQFSELSKEARRLKNQLDEQSDFAVEQIDIAIKAIEDDLQNISEQVKLAEHIYLGEKAYALKARYDFYIATQSELSLLNLYATKVTSLRKELIKTEMRIRSKNKFFDRLSKAGDLVFPRRKDLIQALSDAFMEDVDSFIQEHFGPHESRVSLFDLRDEIKALQSAAKVLTLNTQGFSHARLRLSECWDKLKEKDKERKIELDKRKEEFEKNGALIKEFIEKATLKFESGESNVDAAQKDLEEAVQLMRSHDLGRDELKLLRQMLASFRDQVHAKQQKIEEERLKQEEARIQEKRSLITSFTQKFRSFMESSISLSIDEIQNKKEELLEEAQKSALSKTDRLELEKILKPLKELIREKKELALKSLPSDEREALIQLKLLLESKKEQRQEVKGQLDHYRKLVGASGLDFEKAMEYNARILLEKQKLEDAQNQIREVEGKIEQLENELSTGGL